MNWVFGMHSFVATHDNDNDSDTYNDTDNDNCTYRVIVVLIMIVQRARSFFGCRCSLTMGDASKLVLF